MRLVILLALWPALAHADLPTIDDVIPPAIRVAPIDPYHCGVVLDRAKLDITQAPVSWLVFEVSSKRGCGAIEVSIDVPAKAGVAGMAVSSRGDRSWSAPREVGAARRAFGREGGAALLVWESSSADQDHLRVTIPLPARVEIAIQLPPLDRLVLDAAGHPTAAVDLRGVPSLPRGRARFADARTALVSGAPNRDEPIQETARWSRAPSWWGGKANIRTVMKRDRARLTYCYERVAQWRGEIEGTATMQFFIDAAGAVVRVQTAATDLPPAITRCLEDVIDDWHFEGIEGPVLVNYPLRFSTSDY